MNIKFVVCIPVYNHPQTVVEIIRGCLAQTTYPIIVVDDGSDHDVKELFVSALSSGERSGTELNSPSSERLHFLRHQQNQGKGQAILTAVEYAVEKGFTHMVTIDADGQHLPEEIKRLTTKSEQEPWSIILGDRQMNTQNVPQSSVFGKWFSNFWIKYETDLKVSDSQSGFRIYPLFYLQTMRFFSRRYAFEVEVLTRSIWKGISILSVPITVKYFTPDKRVTHFHKFKDNFRITALNTVLVALSLLRREDPPLKSAVATALGVFVGCLPFYGLHTLIAALLALVLRANFLYIFLGTQISIPPMVPFIIWGSKVLAENLQGHPPEGFFGFSRDWAVGILAFASMASVTVGAITYAIKKLKSSAGQAGQPSGKHKVAVRSRSGLGMAIMTFFLKNLGLGFAYLCLYPIVSFYFLFSLRARQASKELYRVLYKKDSFFKRQIFLFRQLYVFAQTLTDRAYQRFSGTTERQFKIVEVDRLDHFFHGIQSEKGMISLQSHFGGWEMSFNYFQHLKSEKNILAVMYGIPDSFQHTSINETAAQKKLKVTFYNMSSGTVEKLHQSLMVGDIVGLMGDRPVGRSYAMIPFCGKLALIDTSAARLALLCKVDIYCVFCIKTKMRQYEVSIHKISHEVGSIEQIAKEYATVLERKLRQHPEQWFNFYPFWSEKLF